MAADRLPDQLRAGLRLVFVGTAASTRSAGLGHYYAHPGNRFWRALHEAGITPRRYRPDEFSALLDLGIGFTDLSKSGAGMDRQIARQSFDAAAFRTKIERCRPKTVAFTQQEGREPVLSPADARDRTGPAAARERLSRRLRAVLALGRRVRSLDVAAVARTRRMDRAGVRHPALARVPRIATLTRATYPTGDLMTIKHFPPPPGVKAPPLSFAARTGDLLYISGIPGFDENRGLPDTFEAQFRNVVTNIKRVLDEAGGTFRDLVKVNVLLTRASDVAAMNALYAGAFGPAPYPARTTCVVVALPDPKMLIEIEAVAELAGK